MVAPNSETAVAHGSNVEADDLCALVRVLYHALQGASAARQYTDDARRSKRAELVQFFERCRAEDAERINQMKRLLAPLLAESPGPAAEATSAAFAAGDGADDSQISADEQRGKVGNWPAL